MGSLGWVGHVTRGQVDYPLLIAMGAAAMVGSYLGARLTGRVQLNTLILSMGAVLIVVGILLFWRGVGRIPAKPGLLSGPSRPVS